MELTNEQALLKALEAHKEGKLQDAEALYRAILQTQPKHPDANHNLGVIAVSLNQAEAALPLFKTALEANPNQGQFWLSYVDALIKTNQLEIAKSVLEQGKKLGLAGESVEALEAQLTPIRSPSMEEVNGLLEHYQNGRYDLAENLAKNITQKYPDHQFSWKVLGAMFQQTGRLQESLIANQRAVEILPNDAEAHNNLALTLFELGRLDESEESYKKAIEINPNFAEAHNNLGNTLKELKRLEEAESSYRTSIAINSNFAVAHSNLGTTLKKLGLLESAEESYKRAVVINPEYAEAHSNLGVTLLELGRPEEAEVSNKKAIEINPNFAEAHNNLGNTLKELKRLEEAESSYRIAVAFKPDMAEAHYNLGLILQEFGSLEDAVQSYATAIAINPEYAEAYSNLGSILRELGRLEDAKTSYKNAIEIKPDLAEIHNNMGVTLQELGELEEAVIHLKKAVAIQPDLVEAHNNLGISLKKLGKLEDAEKSFTTAIAISPNFEDAHNNLALLLQELGRLEDALDKVIRSIKIKPNATSKILFVNLTKEIEIEIWDQPLAELVITALSEPWTSPSDLLPIALRLLKTDTEFNQYLKESIDDINLRGRNKSFLSSMPPREFSSSKLFRALLSASVIPDTEIEKFLTSSRHHFLNVVANKIFSKSELEEIDIFYCLLAQQCFISEYVFFQTPEEINQSQQLLNTLSAALKDKQDIPAILVIAVACYFPLYSIDGSENLLHQNWSEGIKIVLIEQIQEPLEELNLRRSIPALTSIENHISMEVQIQYEENPYPRWVRLPKDLNRKYLNSYMQSKFSSCGFHRLIDDRNLEVLIAGCGTGQHPIGVSQIIQFSKLLAIDLSMASLAYAKRKSAELGIESIEYAQADILRLASIGRTFNLIESSGVLHHLENPLEGWEILLSVLRPNGLMKLGFYSELARRDIAKVRNLINQNDIGSSPEAIRNYRKYLLGMESSDDFKFASNSMDFFSTSACRDLLFHVQEHRFNLKTINDFIKTHDLNFLGFEINRSVFRSYKERFSNDPSATNLGQWHIYEEENPDTFIGMYQFYVQKKS
jgi:tetratricopeptide (TPR) repeat protein